MCDFDRRRICVVSRLLSFIANHDDLDFITFFYDDYEMKWSIDSFLRKINSTCITHYKRDDFIAVSFKKDPMWYECVNMKL